MDEVAKRKQAVSLPPVAGQDEAIRADNKLSWSFLLKCNIFLGFQEIPLCLPRPFLSFDQSLALGIRKAFSSFESNW